MRICPFCKEEVHAEAVKCRFCHSMLIPFEVPQTPDNGRITYVLDRDLVRFGKFAAAVLAIFLIVGSYLFGFKLESALEKVRTTQEELTTAQQKMASAQKDLQAAQTLTAKLKADVERVLSEAQRVVSEISSQHSMAIHIVASLKPLTLEQQAVAKSAIEQQPNKARHDVRSKLWVAGTRIRVRFLNGVPAVHQKVRTIASEWMKYANITFDFISDGDSEVRISFDEKNGVWSYLGTDVLGIPQHQQTMNLAFTDRRTILHKFGHVLGLIEEHQNPRAKIAWNRELVFQTLSGPPNYWDRTTIENNVFRKATSEHTSVVARDFDPYSIMNMTFPAALTGGVALGGVDQLSESDKDVVSKLYPK
jgi:serralysin